MLYNYVTIEFLYEFRVFIVHMDKYANNVSQIFPNKICIDEIALQYSTTKFIY